MLLVDWEIRDRSDPSRAREDRLLEPFSEGVSGEGVISYGLTSAGYDLRLGHSVMVFKNSFNEIVSPKRMKNDPKYLSRIYDCLENLADHEPVLIPPHGYILGYSLEYIRLSRRLKGRCTGKSSLARCGIAINTTPIEPGWHGHLTLEIANLTCCPVEIYCGEGVAQLEFEVLGGTPEIDYEDKKGTYQGQGPGPVSARVKE